jgi:phage/plasmid-associated DNA primase
MHKDPFEFAPSWLLALVTNHRPTTDGSDFALWSRLHVIGFDQVFDDKADVHLQDELQREADGILLWLFRVYQHYCANGLIVPDVIKQRTQDERDKDDDWFDFFDRNCERGLGTVRFTELHARFDSWWFQRKDAHMTANMFGREMRKRGYAIERGHGADHARIYRNIRLKDISACRDMINN